MPLKFQHVTASRLSMPRSSVVLALVASLALPAAAQTFDPQKQSPMELLAVPDDGVAYYLKRLRAQELIAQRNDAMLRRYCRSSPRNTRATA